MEKLELELRKIEIMIEEIYAGERPGSEMASLEIKARYIESDIRNAHRSFINSECISKSL